MNERTHRVLLVVLICLVARLTSAASASLHLSVGVGAAFGGCHRHHLWCDDWLCYGYPHPYRFWHAYPYRPWCSAPVGVWLDVCPRVVATERYVTVERRAHACPPARDEDAGALTEAMRRKQDELLKVLRIGGREDRLRAARELAGHSCNARVRAALERALLSDRDAEVRRAVAESLAKSGNEKVVSALRRAYEQDADRSVRQAAYRAIIMIEGY